MKLAIAETSFIFYIFFSISQMYLPIPKQKALKIVEVVNINGFLVHNGILIKEGFLSITAPRAGKMFGETHNTYLLLLK